MYIRKNKLSEHDAREVQKMLWEKFRDELDANITDDDEYYAYEYLYDNFIEPKISEAIDIYLEK